MRFLPALIAGHKAAVLPMADTSAERLFRLVIVKDAEAAASLACQMRVDPPLAVWAVCQAWRQDRWRPSSVEELAQWLADRAVAVLRWNPGEPYTPEPALDVAHAFDTLLDTSFQTAEMSCRLAADFSCQANQALLHGLLVAAGAWLTRTARDLQDPPLECLPDWLGGQESSSGQLVAKATAIIRGETSPPPGLDLKAIGDRSEQQCRSWYQSGPPLLDLLRELVAGLARRDVLEREFQHALEAEKLEAMAEFAAGAGHEINNPLAIIGGRAQLLLAEEADPERRRELAVINAQVKRAHEMIADMRLFARPPQPECQRFDLASLIDELASEVALQAADRRIEVARSGDPGPVEIEADATQLAVALRAMCKNSLELVAADGHIGIDLQTTGDHVEIRVWDDGPGLLPEHRRHLFDPFYSARQAGRGLGLGLSKCWRIVTLHGGRIDVESGPKQGATFTIRLPRQT